MGLTPRQEQAARLRGQGLTRDEAARVLGISPKTASRWARLPGFAEAMSRARQELADPTAVATLRDALLATRRDGSPDWQVRVQAARALMSAPPEAVEGAAEPSGPTVHVIPALP